PRGGCCRWVAAAVDRGPRRGCVLHGHSVVPRTRSASLTFGPVIMKNADSLRGWIRRHPPSESACKLHDHWPSCPPAARCGVAKPGRLRGSAARCCPAERRRPCVASAGAELQHSLAWMPTEGKLANKSACQESYSSVKSGRSLA